MNDVRQPIKPTQENLIPIEFEAMLDAGLIGMHNTPQNPNALGER